MTEKISKTIEATLKSAQNQNLVSESTIVLFQKHFDTFNKPNGTRFIQQLNEARTSLQTCSDKDLKELSLLNALVALSINAENLARSGEVQGQLKDRFKKFIQDQEQHLDTIKAHLDKTVISLVHTMHPTIFHSHEAIDFEDKLVAALENNQDIGLVLDNFVAGLKNGTHTITPNKQVTVAQETALELRNLERLHERFTSVMDAWNKAAEETNRPELKRSPEQQKNMLEIRTWGRGADADGREKSTAALLYESIHLDAENGAYRGDTLDLRQNAAEHRNALSAFIQKNYLDSQIGRYGKNSTFKEMVDDFMRDKECAPKYKEPARKWQGAEKSLFQHLIYENKETGERDFKDAFDFVEKITKENITLIPEQIKIDTKEVLSRYLGAKKDFAKANGLDARFTIEELNGKMDGNSIPLLTKWKSALQANNVRNDEGSIVRDKKENLNDPDPVKKEQAIQQWRVDNFLANRKKLNEDRTIVDLSKEERVTLMDVARRLIVINQAMETYGTKPGSSPIATRYQIANFSDATDFMIALKLFAETGIAKVEQGKVTETKLGIMPLLETEKDLQRAETIFTQLLNNDLGKSYFKARGKAEIMVGFSDGAASAGNYASQRAIYKATQKLIRLFKEQMGEDFKVEILQGRGRGYDRGGTGDPQLQFDLMPPEVYQDGRYDVTIQSDLPTDIATARGYGEHYLGGILMGLLQAPLRAREHIRTQDAESALDQISTEASANYQSLVRSHPQTLTLFNALPDNPKRSSRAGARGGTTVYREFDIVRAIPKEYFGGETDLPLANCGLANALTFARNITLQHDPFHQAMMRSVSSGMQRFNPYIAQAYGHATNTTKLVSTACRDLATLKQKLNMPHMNNGIAKEAAAVDNLAHAITLTAAARRENNFKPNPGVPTEKDLADTIRNALFVKTLEVGHTPPIQQKAQQRLTI